MFRITKRLLGGAAAVALLALTAHTAPGKGGGKNTTPPATLTFDDVAGDAITSDGLGPYDASVAVEYRSVTLSIKKGRSLFLDFSDCNHAANLSCEGVFGSDSTSGEVSSAITLTLYGLEGAPNTTDQVGAYLEFQNSGGKWELASLITVYRLADDDGDGVADNFVLEDTGEAPTWLGKFFSQRSPFSNNGGYIEHGSFFMPWGATLHLP